MTGLGFSLFGLAVLYVLAHGFAKTDEQRKGVTTNFVFWSVIVALSSLPFFGFVAVVVGALALLVLWILWRLLVVAAQQTPRLIREAWRSLRGTPLIGLTSVGAWLAIIVLSDTYSRKTASLFCVIAAWTLLAIGLATAALYAYRRIRAMSWDEFLGRSRPR